MAGGRRSHGQGTFWGDLIGPNPTDRGKAGTNRRLLVDGEGGPLSIVVAGANVHDAKLLGGIFKKCVNSQAVYPLSEQHGLEAQERR